MIDRNGNRKKRLLAFLPVAFTLILAGCVQSSGSTSGYGSSTSPRGYISSDPYHYHCTGNCQAGS